MVYRHVILLCRNRNDLGCLIASNTSPWVAPHGGYQPRFGTNPIAIGFPTNGVPVILDIGSSPMIHAQAVMAQLLGQQISPNMRQWRTDIGGIGRGVHG